MKEMKDFLSSLGDEGGPHLVIVGGVHGAGKSSLCAELSEALGWPWLTNQVIRREHPGETLSRDDVHALLRERVKQHMSVARSFVFEHVMSGHYVDKLIAAAEAYGFATHLLYINLRDVSLSLERVDVRKAKGGHDVEREKVARRLDESRANFWGPYRTRATSWHLFDNSGPARRLLAHQLPGRKRECLDVEALERFIADATHAESQRLS